MSVLIVLDIEASEVALLDFEAFELVIGSELDLEPETSGLPLVLCSLFSTENLWPAHLDCNP